MGKVYSTICRRRTIRRFQNRSIPENIITKLANAARLAPSCSNIQPCEFIVVDNPQMVDQIFSCLRWASYIEPAGNPPKGERPVLYIVALINVRLKKKGGESDVAAAIQNILLTAWEEGIGSCWLQSINCKQIKTLLRIPHYLNVNSIIALGYPNEQPVVEIARESAIKYWKDKDGVIHVPKRTLKDVIHRNIYGHCHSSDT
jgi:nitroreductase